MSFEFKECFSADGTKIDGLYEIQPKVFGDARGYFFEVYSERDFFAAGLTMKFVQDNQSYSSKGVLRGFHFQTYHPQGKLVRAISGKIYDVSIDLRSDSKTFGKYYGIILDSEIQNEIYVPEGFAHGFYVLSDYAVVGYKCSDFYDPKGESGIIWNDPVLNVNWNSVLLGNEPLLSEKDAKFQLFNPRKKYYDSDGVWIGI